MNEKLHVRKGEIFNDVTETLEAENKALRLQIEKLMAVVRAAEPMLKQMKLINGPDEKCVIHEWKKCNNHSIIHEMESALVPFREGEGK